MFKTGSVCGVVMRCEYLFMRYAKIKLRQTAECEMPEPIMNIFL